MRIAISGTACQGKSTLIEDFKSEWLMYTTPEKTYRDYLTENNLQHSKETNKATQWGILNHMVDSLQQYEKNDKVIFDRCPLDNIIYSLWAYDRNINDIDDEFIKKCIPVARESLRFLDVIFYIPITKAAPIPIVEDELRETDSVYITEVDNLFKAVGQQYLTNSKASTFLPSSDCPAIIELFGSRAERMHMIRQYIDAEGDILGENESNAIFGEESLAMEQILFDQQTALKQEQARLAKLNQKILSSKNSR
jgi:hypothetical protein